MNRDKLIDYLNDEYPPIVAMEDDVIGLEVKGKEDISKVLVTLDISLDVISQALSEEVDMIISHHPLFFGDKMELLDNNPILKAQVQMLVDKDINIFAIHTNADFAPNSIAFNQALALETEEIIQTNENQSVLASLKEEMTLQDLIQQVREKFDLNYSFRSNANLTDYVKELHIASGASGDLVLSENNINRLFIVGEMKHHH
jgi:dinuclear metal center YbgI/SA1388 family protein